MDALGKLAKLEECFAYRPLPADIFELIEEELGVTFNGRYCDMILKNPLLVAPGQLTISPSQITTIREAAYAGCILKSVVGESPDSKCSMLNQRKPPTYIRTFYEPSDVLGEFPIIHWNGRCDTRNLAEYTEFARQVKCQEDQDGFVMAASILCHLPLPHEDFLEDEWTHTSRVIYEAGYSHIEIDFCPFLSRDDHAGDYRNVLRWYRTCPGLIKSVSNEISVLPKMLNLGWGLEFQLMMAEAAVEGGADGLVVANRIYKEEYGSGHGGEELRQRNLIQVREIRKKFPRLSISATGGVYSGKHVYDYLSAGADNVQLLSYLMGKVRRPFTKTNSNKFEKVLHHLLLDGSDGLFACMLRARGLEALV